MKLNIVGIDKLQIALDAKSDLSGVKKVVKTNAAELQRTVARSVPVQTGFLRRSFIMNIEDDGLTGKVSSNVEYGPYVEYGTFNQAAQPFMRPSLNYITPLFMSDIKRVIGE